MAFQGKIKMVIINILYNQNLFGKDIDRSLLLVKWPFEFLLPILILNYF